jgi:glycerophosphoryl diester phosphodiesterase
MAATASMRACIACAILLLAGCGDGGVKPFVAALEAPVHVSHRGGSASYPEDTLYAFERAVADDGTDLLELDVHTSADGVLVVHHDDDVDRTTDGSGPIHALTLAEIQQLDAAWWFTTDDGQTFPLRGQGITIPTLQDVLVMFPDVPLSIEAKQIDPPLVEELTSMIVDHDRVDSVMLASFDDATIEAMQELLPEVAVNFGENATRCVVFQHLLQAGWGSCIDGDVLTLPPSSSGLPVITDSLLASARAQGIPVLAWTIDDPTEMEELLAQGVDGIMTDRPDLLRGVIDDLEGE